MSKPIQICATHARASLEQFGQTNLFVLTDDGRIFHQEWGGSTSPWEELKGPWCEEETATRWKCIHCDTRGMTAEQSWDHACSGPNLALDDDAPAVAPKAPPVTACSICGGPADAEGLCVREDCDGRFPF